MTCCVCSAKASDYHSSLFTQQWNKVCRACEEAMDIEYMRLFYKADKHGIETRKWGLE